MGSTTAIGNRAEELAAEYLALNRFTVLHRNWRSGRYEIDIIAEKEGTLHIVEVKCRKRNSLTLPEDAITSAKYQALKKAAESYVAEYDINLEIQFDLIAVDYDLSEWRLRYIPNAMIPRW